MVDRANGLHYDIGNGYNAIDAEAARDRLDGYAVTTGLGVTPGTGLEVDVAAGEATVGLSGGSVVTVSPGSAQTVALDAADSQFPRKDTVWIDDTGTASVTTGVAEEALPSANTRFNTYQPEPPYPSGDVTILAEVWVPAGASSLTSADVRDRRQPAEVVGGTAYIDQLGQSVDAGGNDVPNVGSLDAADVLTGGLTFDAATTKTVSSGAISVNANECVLQIDGEADSSDALETINGGQGWQLLILVKGAENITVSDSTGNITLDGGVDKDLSDSNDRLVLLANSSASFWQELAYMSPQ